jgi:hypothetical protein
MKVEKARKRIEKHIKRGFKGYPSISLAYFGPTSEMATDVVITYQLDETSEPQAQKFSAEGDIRNDEAIQTVLLKIIERTQAISVTETEEIKRF